eukprot:scaffold1561_cov73-Isochrysis_galbana.AAC.1
MTPFTREPAQAIAVFSLSLSPAPPRWPDRIGHSELALQRALCIDDTRTVGQLWREGHVQGGEDGGASVGEGVGGGGVDGGGGGGNDDNVAGGGVGGGGGGGGRRGLSINRGLRWSYVPIIAWLKPFPSHAPMLLPLGMVLEAEWISPPALNAMALYTTGAGRRQAVAEATFHLQRPGVQLDK